MVEQNRSGVYTQIVYAPTGAKLALMNGQALQKAFLPLTGGATAVYTASGLSYYRHSDWLGSSRLASTPTRTVYSSTAYAPFGEPYAQSGTADLSFTGQNQDTAGGSYDFLAREYAIQGRWPSPDPMGGDIGNPQSLNRYAYVLNNPLALTDPLGLDPEEREHKHIDVIDAISLHSSCGSCSFAGPGEMTCYTMGIASSCGIISRMDPFDVLTTPVVGSPQWVYLDAPPREYTTYKQEKPWPRWVGRRTS
jgi:RHS repeat-associated protein